jgi:hypothetical protein
VFTGVVPGEFDVDGFVDGFIEGLGVPETLGSTG